MRYSKISFLCVIIFFVNICGCQEEDSNVDDANSDVQDDDETDPVDDIRRVHAGVKAKVGDYKFALGFILRGYITAPNEEGLQSSICTATVIGRRSILTAGHCIPRAAAYCLLKGEAVAKAEGYSFSGITFTIYGGAVDMSLETGANLQMIQVSHPDEVTMHLHPDAFTFSQRPNGILKSNIQRDFLLLQLLTKEIQFNNYVRPIPLLKNPIPSRIGDLCKALGFGNQDDIKQLRDQLLYSILVDVGGTEYCNELRGMDMEKRHHVCAFGKGMMDTCSGDSGGPLVCGMPESYYLVGVLSVGQEKLKTGAKARLKGCGETNSSFGVYGFTGVVENWLQNLSTDVKYITHEEAEAMQKVKHPRPTYVPPRLNNGGTTTTPLDKEEAEEEEEEGSDDTIKPKIKQKVRSKKNDASDLHSSEMLQIISTILLFIVLCNNERYK